MAILNNIPKPRYAITPNNTFDPVRLSMNWMTAMILGASAGAGFAIAQWLMGRIFGK